MLCQFSCRNYRSFRDETEFSMQATKMREFSDSLIPGGDAQTFLPVAVIYGPNAGGKSNFIEALRYVCGAVAVPIVTLLYGDEATYVFDSAADLLPLIFVSENLNG